MTGYCHQSQHVTGKTLGGIDVTELYALTLALFAQPTPASLA